jgi:1-acyl-sn-glycerol-3-phosphate acyltransferase
MTAPDEIDIPPLPPDEEIDRLVGLLRPLTRITQPKVYGIENVPESHALLVGNHTIYGFLDLPFMMAALWQERGITVRGLGEHGHYAIPVWRDFLARCGMVRGTRANCGELLRRGENVLVFPGGAREVNKRKGEKYTLIWKQRMGFARLAIQHGTAIVPFAGVGAEEMLDIVLDTDNPLLAPLARAAEKTIGWKMQPLVRGVGPTPLPKPQRLYFWFGEPIPTAQHEGRHEDEAVVRAVRDQVKSEIERGIEFLLAERERDPKRGLVKRLTIGPAA